MTLAERINARRQALARAGDRRYCRSCGVPLGDIDRRHECLMDTRPEWTRHDLSRDMTEAVR